MHSYMLEEDEHGKGELDESSSSPFCLLNPNNMRVSVMVFPCWFFIYLNRYLSRRKRGVGQAVRFSAPHPLGGRLPLGDARGA